MDAGPEVGHSCEPEQKVNPGEIVPCEIAIWPTSALFHVGEKLVVDISGKYGVKDDLLKGFNNLVNDGRHTIYTGGRYNSYLLAPLIPEARSYGIFGGRKVAEDEMLELETRAILNRII